MPRVAKQVITKDHPLIDEEGEKQADDYIANCKKYDIAIDPGVVIALKTKWHLMQPTKQFSEGAMLPLLGVLDQNTSIRNLNLASTTMNDKRYRYAGNGNTNARILNYILKQNTSIEELNLSNTGLDDDGIGEICDALGVNKSITKLNISRNYFSSLGAERLRKLLEENKTLKFLDLQNNALGFQSIQALTCYCDKLQINTLGNYVFEEILNSVSHGIGFLLAIIGSILLMSEAADVYKTDYHFWACLLFSFSLMFLFMSSCLFHSFFMLPQASRVLQILDHVGIYMLIAGSYTPFMLLGLHHHTAATALLIALWLVAIGGSVFSASSDLNNPVTNNIELVLFLSMGCSVIIVLPTMLESFCTEVLMLLFIGCGAYVVGIFFFIMGEKRPIYHVIWHLFVMIAAALHWFAVYFFMVHSPLEKNFVCHM